MKKLVISPRVEFSLSPLKADDVRGVHAWFDHLKRWDEDESVRRSSVPLDAVPGVYLMRTSTDLRIFFRIDGETITVLDVARLSTILTSSGVHTSANSNGVASPDTKVK